MVHTCTVHIFSANNVQIWSFENMEKYLAKILQNLAIYRTFETNIRRKGTADYSPNSHVRPTYFPAAE